MTHHGGQDPFPQPDPVCYFRGKAAIALFILESSRSASLELGWEAGFSCSAEEADSRVPSPGSEQRSLSLGLGKNGAQEWGHRAMSWGGAGLSPRKRVQGQRWVQAQPLQDMEARAWHGVRVLSSGLEAKPRDGGVLRSSYVASSTFLSEAL